MLARKERKRSREGETARERRREMAVRVDGASGRRGRREEGGGKREEGGGRGERGG